MRTEDGRTKNEERGTTAGTVVKLPCGKSVTLGARYGKMELDVDLEYVGRPEDEKGWKGPEVMARTITHIDGKPVPGYTLARMITDFDSRNVAVITAAHNRLVSPTPEEVAAGLEGFMARDALLECVQIYRLTGGAVAFENAMEWPERKRKLILGALIKEMEALEAVQKEIPNS
jgi:hypothetical protein